MTKDFDAFYAPLKFLFSNGPACVFVCETTGNYRTKIISDNINKILGYTSKEFIDSPNLWINLLHDEDRKKTISGLKSKLKTMKKNESYSHQYRLKHKNGHYVWIRADLTLNCENDQKYFAGYFIDISENKKTNHLLKCKTKELETKNKDLEDFCYVVSHDLREPLVSVAGFASLVRKRYEDQLDEQGILFLDRILEGTKRMENKIDDLLALSRAGREDPNGHTLHLKEAIEEATQSLYGSISKHGAKIIIEKDMPKVKGDYSMIVQVFQNLLSNSIKYRKTNETPIVTIYTTPFNGYYQITLEDNGVGFDIKHHDRIFGVFQRLHSTEDYPGTGIGLAIVKKIIEKHKGSVWAESEIGKGTKFHFTLKSL